MSLSFVGGIALGDVHIDPLLLCWKAGYEDAWAMYVPSNESRLGSLSQHQGHALLWGALSSSWPDNNNSPMTNPFLTGISPPCLTDSLQLQVVASYLGCNLCCSASFKHGSDIPCSDVNDGPGSDDGLTFTTWCHTSSSWRPILSQDCRASPILAV